MKNEGGGNQKCLTLPHVDTHRRPQTSLSLFFSTLFVSCMSIVCWWLCVSVAFTFFHHHHHHPSSRRKFFLEIDYSIRLSSLPLMAANIHTLARTTQLRRKSSPLSFASAINSSRLTAQSVGRIQVHIYRSRLSSRYTRLNYAACM